MERDSLEKFIDTHRQAFDQALPDHDLWNKIEGELPDFEVNREGGKVIHLSNPIIHWIKYAAAVAAIVSISVFGTMQYMKSSQLEGISNEVMVELNELKDYYDFEVNRKLNQLAAFDNVKNLNSELSNIDNIIEELKKELEVVPKGNEEKVINAMIHNFQLKVLILERVIEGKESNLNNSENNNYEVNL